MAILPRPSSPRAAWRDMIGFVRERRRHQMVFAALAIGVTIAMLGAFVDEFNRKEVWKPPVVTYVKQWPASRSLADVRAQQARDLPAELAEKKRLEALEAEQRAQFQRARKQLHDIGI